MEKIFKKISGYYPLMICMVIIGALLSLGIHQIYHQDEYRWVDIAQHISWTVSIHPPIASLLFAAAGRLFGFNMLRIVPAFFAILNLILVYCVCLKLTKNKNIAALAALLFSFNAYSLIAGLQIDIDGALLPFFIFLAYLSYLHVLEKDKRWYWVFGISIIGGLLTKLSFVIGLGALAGDWSIRMLVEKNISISRLFQEYWKWLAGAVVALGAAYLVMGYFLPDVLAYAMHFQIFDFNHRAYLDLGFKILKSLVMLGPLLFLGGLAVLWRPNAAYRYRFFLLYLTFCTLFYAVIFDFTTLTIERYFMFMIIPFVILAAEPITELFTMIKHYRQRWHLAAIGGTAIIFLVYLLSLPKQILPLDPKSAYAHQVLSGHLNFLIPITGGSGPIGFYVSALFIAVVWIIVALALLATRSRRELIRVAGAMLFLVVGLFATVIVLGEFLFGGLYGSPNRLAWETVDYINANPAIHQQQVITYYDIAAYNLQLSGKYYSRFYTTPTRDYVPKVTTFRGYYMIVDFPFIGTDDRYWKLITRCPIDKQFQDGLVHSYVFDCTNLP